MTKQLALSLTDKEYAVVQEMAKALDLSPQQVLIQGLRHYQKILYEREHGELVVLPKKTVFGDYDRRLS